VCDMLASMYIVVEPTYTLQCQQQTLYMGEQALPAAA
jgi:hypothetical protein